MNPEFPHAPIVLSWLDRARTLHPDQSPFISELAEQVETRSDTTLHYGALGLRGQVEDELAAGRCTPTQQRLLDTLLWAIEVLADDNPDETLHPDTVAAMCEVALTASRDSDLDLATHLVDAAEHARWNEWDELAQLLPRLRSEAAAASAAAGEAAVSAVAHLDGEVSRST